MTSDAAENVPTGLAFGVEGLLGFAQALAAVAGHAQLDGQLIAARIPCSASSASSTSAASSRIARPICAYVRVLSTRFHPDT